MTDAPRPVQRADKWLFCARFFKTRTLAAALVSKGRLRVNGTKVGKPAHGIGPGDVLTFPQAGHIRVVRVLAPAERRGPAAEARALYEDVEAGNGRPAGSDETGPPVAR